MGMDSVMAWSQIIFARPFVMLLLITGAWSVLMTGTALAERDLLREARITRLVGWAYIAIALVGFLVSRIYAVFFP